MPDRLLDEGADVGDCAFARTTRNALRTTSHHDETLQLFTMHLWAQVGWLLLREECRHGQPLQPKKWRGREEKLACQLWRGTLPSESALAGKAPTANPTRHLLGAPVTFCERVVVPSVHFNSPTMYKLARSPVAAALRSSSVKVCAPCNESTAARRPRQRQIAWNKTANQRFLPSSPHRQPSGPRPLRKSDSSLSTSTSPPTSSTNMASALLAERSQSLAQRQSRLPRSWVSDHREEAAPNTG